MKKILNQKGFAITSFLYSIFLLIVLFLVAILLLIFNSSINYFKMQSQTKNKLDEISYNSTGINNYAQITFTDETPIIPVGQNFNLLEGVYLIRYDGIKIENNITYTSHPAFNKDVPGKYVISYESIVDGKTITKKRIITVKKANIKQEEILITNVYVGDFNNVDKNNIYVNYYQSTLTSDIVLSTSNHDSNVTFNVTLCNNTNDNYIFTGMDYEENLYEKITFQLSDLSVGNEIPSKSTLNFSVTFQYAENVIPNDLINVLKSTISFNFDRKVIPELTQNMIPVYYEDGNWKKTDSNSSNWHAYYDGKWANAVTYSHNLIYNKVEDTQTVKTFNGTSDYYTLGSANYDFKKAITVVARVKLHAYSDKETGIVGNPDGAGFYLIKNPKNKFGFEFYNTSTNSYQVVTSNFTPELNQWYTLVGTYDGSILKLYVDGALNIELPFSGSIKTSVAPIMIGGNPNEDGTPSGGYFNGAMSEVIVMTDVLTETEIAQRYGNTINHTPDSHNVLYYLKYDGNNGYVHHSASYEKEGMLFDGVDDFVTVGYSSYNFSNTLTVAARVKIHDYSDEEYGIVGNPQGAGFYLMKNATNQFELIVRNNNINDYSRVTAPTKLELNTWYTVVATCDKTSLKLYINGVLVKTAPVTMSMKLSDIPIMIGVNPTINSTLGGSYLNGMISDVLIIDEALTQTQIKNNYSSSLNTVVSNKTLISYDFRSYEERENNTVIPEEMIDAMWVWIPRFSAQTSINDSISIKLVGSDQNAHDAFSFDGQELEGFWIGKFENASDVISKNVDTNIYIKPNYSSIRNKTIGSMFNSIKNISSSTSLYNFEKNQVDTHLIKNNEWAAVAYFTRSKYGLCNDKTCKELEKNNLFKTGGENYFSNSLQSTTSNIYGVYDMNGGVEEFVMGNYNNTLTSYDDFSILPNEKYLNIYTNSENYELLNLQHALLETTKFNELSSNFVTPDNVWFSRNDLFSYNSTTGAANENIGSRTILIIK